MHKATLEQYFTVTSTISVTIFHTSLKLVKEKVGVKIPNKYNKHSTSHG